MEMVVTCPSACESGTGSVSLTGSIKSIGRLIMNHYIAMRRALNHLEFVRKEWDLPAAFIKDQRRDVLNIDERNQLADFEEAVTDSFDDSYLWNLKRSIRSMIDDIQGYRRDMRLNRDSLGKRIHDACEKVRLKANRLFSQNEGTMYGITVETVNFYNSRFSGPTVHIKRGVSYRDGTWIVTCQLHKSWYDRVGSKGNHCFMVGGHKVFTINAMPVPHNFKGVDMERIAVFGKRSKAALDREHHRLHNLIDEIPEDERHDPELNEYFHDLVAELSHIDGASIEDRPTVHNLYLCTSQDQTDLDGNHLKGVGSTPEQAFKLMERRVRDTFVKELAV